MTPLPFRWTGEAMEPTPGFRRRADAAFVVGEVYLLEPIEERSTRTHNHQFAWLTEAWKNLPERLVDTFPTPEHLRKRALIDAGFYDETVVDAGTQAAALRVAALVRGLDGFAVVATRGPIVVIRRAKSQNRRAMTATEFAASKAAVLDVVSAMLEVSPETLQHNTGGAR